MKVRDLIKTEIDIDVIDDYTAELEIAFVGPIKLTEEGEKQFYEVMEYDVKLHSDDSSTCIVHCENDVQFRKAEQFFYAAAGWCSEKNYDKWFDLSE